MNKWDKLDEIAELFSEEYGGEWGEVKNLVACIFSTLLFSPEETGTAGLIERMSADWPETMARIEKYVDEFKARV